MSDNPVRPCLYCGIEDDHPRHQKVLADFSSVYAHMDCCAQVTGCELCVPVVKGAKGKTGEELRTYIMTKKG